MLNADLNNMIRNSVEKRACAVDALRRMGFQPVSAGGHLACRVALNIRESAKFCSVFAKLAAWPPSQARCLTSDISASPAKRDGALSPKSEIRNQQSAIAK